MSVLPVFFDERVVGQAHRFFEMGKPKITPIYIRNRVKINWSDGFGTFSFFPIHDEFYLENDKEVILMADQRGWNNTYAGCVNPAVWPENLRENLDVLLKVDPTLKGRLSGVFQEHGLAIRQSKNNYALNAAMHVGSGGGNKVLEFSNTYGNKFMKVTIFDNGTCLVHSSDAFAYPGTIIKVELKDDFQVVTLTHMGKGGDLEIVEMQDEIKLIGRHEDLAPLIQECALDTNYWYAEVKRGLQAYAEELKKDFNTPYSIDLPVVEPLEKGYPKLELPAQIRVSRSPGVLRTSEELGKLYEAQQRMLESLGYVTHRRSKYASNTGRTASKLYFLKGKVANPRDVDELILKVDLQKGIIFVKDGNIGRVIGQGGENIKVLKEATGRNWKIEPYQG